MLSLTRNDIREVIETIKGLYLEDESLENSWATDDPTMLNQLQQYIYLFIAGKEKIERLESLDSSNFDFDYVSWNHTGQCI